MRIASAVFAARREHRYFCEEASISAPVLPDRELGFWGCFCLCIFAESDRWWDGPVA